MTLVLLLALVGVLYHTVAPRFSDTEYAFGGQSPASEHIPFFLPTRGDILTVTTVMTLQSWHPKLFILRPDDCITALTINGIRVPSEMVQFCEYGEGRRVDLSPYVHPGTNDVRILLSDSGGLGGINISMARTDPLSIAVCVLFAFLLFAYAFFLFRLPSVRARRAYWTIFCVGVLLRIFYVFVTPVTVRAHDVGGHLDYIRFILAHWSIPHAEDGWEFHQPPLYYALAAVWTRAWDFFGDTGMLAALRSLQISSLIFSLGALAMATWIGVMLFPKERQRLSAALFLAIVAVFPGLLYIAARVSNDALSHFLSFTALALLLRWWQTKSHRVWYLLAVIIGLACLTKISAAVLLAAALLCLLLRSQDTWRSKLFHGSIWLLLVGSIAGWLAALRLFLEKDITRTVLLGNKGMDHALAVPQTGIAFLVFHPWEILRVTFNEPWTDLSRRQFFWEFFFKSAFFGEYQFEAMRWLCIAILTCGLLMIPLIFAGIVTTLRQRARRLSAVPVLVTFVLLLAAAVLYAAKFRYAPNQDFRFSVLLIVPVAFFIVTAIEAVRSRFLRYFYMTLVGLFVALQTAFIVLLPVSH